MGHQKELFESTRDTTWDFYLQSNALPNEVSRDHLQAYGARTRDFRVISTML